MKRLMLSIGIILLFANCHNKESDGNSKLLGNDYRLFDNTPLSNLAEAVKNEDTVKIKEEVSKQGVAIDYREPLYGSTLLMLSIKNSNYRSTEKLLQLGANPNLHDSYRGETPVISAANNNDIRFLQLILFFKGDPNSFENAATKPNDEVRQTALLTAINPLDTNSLQKVKLLVDAGANVNYYNEGHTDSPLSEAITARNMQVVLYLLEKGADSNQIIYKEVNGKKVFILEALRKCVFDLNSEQYKSKLEVIAFLKKQGKDYHKEPIPSYILKKIKKAYPENWELVAQKY